MKKIIALIFILFVSVSALWASNPYMQIGHCEDGETRMFFINGSTHTIYTLDWKVYDEGRISFHNGNVRFEDWYSYYTQETIVVETQTINEMHEVYTNVETGFELHLYGIDYDIYEHNNFWAHEDFYHLPVTREEYFESLSLEEVEEEAFEPYVASTSSNPHTIYGTWRADGEDSVLILRSNGSCEYVNMDSGEVLESGRWELIWGNLVVNGNRYAVEWTGDYSLNLVDAETDEVLVSLEKMGVETKEEAPFVGK